MTQPVISRGVAGPHSEAGRARPPLYWAFPTQALTLSSGRGQLASTSRTLRGTISGRDQPAGTQMHLFTAVTTATFSWKSNSARKHHPLHTHVHDVCGEHKETGCVWGKLHVRQNFSPNVLDSIFVAVPFNIVHCLCTQGVQIHPEIFNSNNNTQLVKLHNNFIFLSFQVRSNYRTQITHFMTQSRTF